MELAVSVAPYQDGFRASTGGPLDLTADGPTADAAVEALRAVMADRVGVGRPRPMSPADFQSFLAAAAELGRSPNFDAWKEEVAERRRLHNTVPDGDA